MDKLAQHAVIMYLPSHLVCLPQSWMVEALSPHIGSGGC